MSRLFANRATLLLSALVAASFARADTQGRPRVTIRGTGSDVVIERSDGPVRKRPSAATAVSAPAGPLDEAVHLKARGASDSAVISYPRAHESQLPPVVDSEDVKQLKNAGAGKSVVAYLTTVAAVDIGETGEGRETAVFGAPGRESGMEGAPYDVSPDAYPFYGYGGASQARVHSRGLPRVRRMPLPPGRPVAHAPVPMPVRGLSRRHAIAE